MNLFICAPRRKLSKMKNASTNCRGEAIKIHTLTKASIALLAGSLLVVNLSGCDIVAQRAADEAERAVEEATGVRVDVPTPAEESEAQLPEGWPTEAPVYPEATITDSVTTTLEGSTQYSVVFRTRDAHPDVSVWFENEFEAKGWTIDAARTIETSQGISTTYIASIDKLECVVHIGIVDGEVEIAQQVSVTN